MSLEAATIAAVLAAAGLAATLTAMAMAHRCRRRARHLARRLDRLLATAPARALAAAPDGTLTLTPGTLELLGIERIERLEDVAQALAPESGRAFTESLTRFIRTGEGFRLTAGTADRARHLALSGTRDADGGAVLWIEDATEAETVRHALAAERRAAVTDLAELRGALDGLPVPIWLRRDDLAIAWCNRAYARLVDATPESAVSGQRELTDGGSGAVTGRVLAERAGAGGQSQSEPFYAVVDASRHRFEVTEIPLPGTVLPGTVLPGIARTVGVAIDQTELEALRAELKRHVSAHAEVLEQVGSAVAVFGPDTRLKFYNQAFTRLSGAEETWLATEPTYGDFLEDMRARRQLPETIDFRQHKKQRLAMFSSLLEPLEEMLHLPDGSTQRMLVSPHPLGGLLFLFDDVTNTLALESSYNTLIAVQQETLDNLAEGIAVYGGDGRLKLFNPAFARIWDLASVDLKGEPHIVEVLDRLKRFFPYGDDWDIYRDDLVASTLDRTARQGRVERTDGAVVEFATVPLPDGAVLNSFLDVTDSARVEQALRASNAALEAADQLKSEFVANVSYHLRTPLTAVMGFAQVLAEQYFGPLNERQLDYARHILDGGDRLLTLINDILDLATIEAGHMVLERSTVAVPAMLGVVAALTREWARKQGLELVLECPPDLGVIEADEKRLKQALFNLVSNAIRFTPSGGRITLAAQRSREVMVLSVSDTGPGIAGPDQQRVLRRFERADASIPQGTGAGLGLALVKSFIELHGGRIVIDSDAGKGTTIHCVLPTRPFALVASQSTSVAAV